MYHFGIAEAAQPTRECPRKFGLFKLGDATDCGHFMSCVYGRAYMFTCPEGLAFNELTLKCDWPDLVPSCNPESKTAFAKSCY